MKKLMKMLMAAMAVLAILHCRAEKVCIVTFDANGGFFEDYDEFGNFVCPREISWEIEEGQSLGWLPRVAIEPDDSYFIGWFDTNGVEFTESTVVTNDMTVTARWIVGHPWTQEDDGSWRSGAISDGQSSSTELFVVGPAVVSFKWKVSSESYWDKLSFTIDADYRCEISGEMAEWETKTFTVNSGDHYLSWTYSKDGSMSNGEDCGWVKDIVVTTNILTFTGTLDANGGMFVDGMETHSVENLALFELPTPRRSNCAFLGWFTAADGGEEVTIATEVVNGTTLYAHWEEYTFNYIDNGDGTVTLDPYNEYGWWVGGVSPSPVGEVIVPDEIDDKRVVAIRGYYFSGCSGMTSVVIPASVKDIDDYVFDGCANLTVQVPDSLYNRFYVPYGCTVEYYEIPKYTVTFNANGGTIKGSPVATRAIWVGWTFGDYDKSIGLPRPRCDGYALIGWFTDAEGGEEVLADTAVAPDMTLYAHWMESPFTRMSEDRPWTPEDDGSWRSGTTSYGQPSSAELFVVGPAAVSFKWKMQSPSLRFAIDGDYLCECETSGAEWKQKTFLVDDGEHLLGWVYENQWGGADEGWVKDIIVTNILVFTGTLNANGGVLADGRERNDVENLALAELPTPRRSNHAFLGWFTAAEGGDEVTIMTEVANGTTLYAHWEEIVYTFNYIDNGDGTVTLSPYDEYGQWIDYPIDPSPVGDFAIPRVIDNKLVVGIGSSFFNCASLKSVTIPDSVKYIGDAAFSGCLSLREVSIPSSVTNIGCQAFYGTSLGEVSIPGSVEWIGEYAFGFCYDLTNVTFVLTGELAEIGPFAFYSCHSLAEISIPDSVTNIDNYAFCGCSSLAEVTIPSRMERIGCYAFDGCSSLETVTFAGTEGDIDIHYTAFYGTPYDANKPFSLIVENGVVVGFHGTCPATLSASDFHVGVTSIGNNAFMNTSFVDVTIPAGVTNIGVWAFAFSASLTNVVIPATVKTASGAFYGIYENLTIHAPSTLRDTLYVPSGCTVVYYDVAEYDVVVGAGGNVVADNGDGSFTITPPAGGVLSGADVAAVTVTADVNGESVNVTDRFSIVLGDGIITVSPKVEIDCMVDVALKDADDKSGFLVDPSKVTLATEPSPDMAQGETLGALPVKTIPGLWYQASWGDSLDDMTSGAKVQASGLEMYLGVIKQTGASGFYKVSVSNE